jgi:hypothetical protein
MQYPFDGFNLGLNNGTAAEQISGSAHPPCSPGTLVMFRIQKAVSDGPF